MDKQDDLVRVIGDAYDSYDGVLSAPYEVRREMTIDAIAAAVRSFMGSPETVERAARAIADDLKSRAVYVSDDLRNCLVDGGLFDLHDPARAALSAAVGEDIGGGRG